MGTELPTKIMLGQTLVLMQMTFLNNVRKVGRLVLSITSCFSILRTFHKRNRVQGLIAFLVIILKSLFHTLTVD
jgi:hypothetical protein